ncbi:hypothetical protein [Streptomyces sp. SID3212]|uniref:hypothetical protein n=1 Tax=Streptomyces sp. SID3212 TaxID=2690259 RepID=UPI001370755B|nr:hypothetical protein [Streptomyces sp. SID3212]MYV58022.1 hypothetical protein [Streptomyces sp. SID3212]
MSFKVEIVIHHIDEIDITTVNDQGREILPAQPREIARLTVHGPRAFVKDVISGASMAMDEIEAF